MAPARSPKWLAAACLFAWVAFVGAAALRPRPIEFDPWLDAGLYNLAFVVAAVACARRWRRAGADRAGWAAMAAGIALFTLGNVYGSLVVGERDIYPSPADWMWLSFYVCAYAAVVLFVQARMRSFSLTTWLDGAIAGTGAAALVAVFALGPVLRLTDGRFAVVATNLAYPTADVLLIVAVVAAGYAVAARDSTWWLLGAGLGVMCIGDVVFLFQDARDLYQEGSLVDITWPLAVALLGVAACRPAPTAAAPERDQSFLAPGLFAASSTAILAFGGRTISTIEAMLALATLVLAATRTALTVREVRRLGRSRAEARTDELTGLSNRRHLIEAIDAGLAARIDTTLMMIDLDRFKDVNDSLGHAAGDQLLVVVSERLLSVVPPAATVARLGGDEFAVALPACRLEDAVALATRVRAALVEPLVIDGVELTVDASAGIASSALHAGTRDELLARADVAMYRAKRERTRVETFDPAGPMTSRGSLTLLAELRRALADRDLDLHYQPRLDLRSGRVDGVEALVRWHHPQRGLLAPDAFLPLVLDADLGPQLLEFVVERGARDLRRLRQLDRRDLSMSINVFPSDLRSGTLVDLLRLHVDGDGLTFGDITVEVTEEAFGAGSDEGRAGLAALVELGVRLSIDDFGTGHASLSRIRDVPLHELKLDRSFMVNVPFDGHNAAIVQATIGLAHAIGLPIVAEGVETEDALQWLAAAGCDVAQGYHVARPMAFEQLVAWLRERSPAAVCADATTMVARGGTARPGER